MDPHSVLGLPADASIEDATDAYKRLAKRWHPDVAGADATRQMADFNVAFDLLRASFRPAADGPQATAGAKGGSRGSRARAGDWLADAVRRALGPELLSVLEPDERVDIVTPAATWASPSTLLAVTDRRLLWVLDDAVSNRVRFLRFRDVAHAELRPMWPRRSRARLRVQPRYGRRRWTFSDLRPATAQAISRLLSEARAAASA